MAMTEKSSLHQTHSPCFFPVALIEAVFPRKVWISERQHLTEVEQEIGFTRFLPAVIIEEPQVVLSVNRGINQVDTIFSQVGIRIGKIGVDSIPDRIFVKSFTRADLTKT